MVLTGGGGKVGAIFVAVGCVLEISSRKVDGRCQLGESAGVMFLCTVDESQRSCSGRTSEIGGGSSGGGGGPAGGGAAGGWWGEATRLRRVKAYTAWRPLFTLQSRLCRAFMCKRPSSFVPIHLDMTPPAPALQ